MCMLIKRNRRAEFENASVAGVVVHGDGRTGCGLGLSGLLPLVVMSLGSLVDTVSWHVPSPAQDLEHLALSSVHPDV